MDTISQWSTNILDRSFDLLNSTVNYILVFLMPPSPYLWLGLASFALILLLQFKFWKERESELRNNGSNEFTVFISFVNYAIVSVLYAVIFPLGLFYLFARTKTKPSPSPDTAD